MRYRLEAGPSRSALGEDEAAARHAATDRGKRNFGARDLSLPCLTPQLRDRLGDEAVAMGPTGRQLTAVGVDRQLAVERDSLTTLEEVLGLTDTAEAEPLEPASRC